MSSYIPVFSAFDTLGVVLPIGADSSPSTHTNGYASPRTVLQSGPADQGVQHARILKEMNPGPAVITSIDALVARSAHESVVQGGRERNEAISREHYIASEDLREFNSVIAWQEDELRRYEEAVTLAPRHYLEGASTDVPRDFVHLYAAEFAYEASAVVARAHEDMTGTLINLIA